MRNRPVSYLLILFTLGIASLAVEAQDRGEVTERMRERLPAVDAMLKEERVGENNRGLLTARGDLNEEQRKTMEAENQDRSTVYRLVAERTGQSVEEVARQRAMQIRQRAAAGIWLQAADGEWYKKE